MWKNVIGFKKLNYKKRKEKERKNKEIKKKKGKLHRIAKAQHRGSGL